MKPIIAVSTGYHVDGKGREVCQLYAHYLEAVRRAGGVPVAVPPLADADEADAMIARADGLLLTGGDDIRPERFGQPLHPAAELMHPKRETSDFLLLRAADRRGLPTLGICLGFQEINVSRGGTLHQHIPDVKSLTLRHSGAYPDRASHGVRLSAGTWLRQMVAADELTVNSAHHQGVDRVGDGLKVAALSTDGLVEALETTDPYRFLLAVQWHPEEMPDREEQRRLFRVFVEACGK